MSAMLRLRCLTQNDLPFADSLRAREGWNQTIHDWERFLAMEPAGCFLAEWQGVPAGTATTVVYGAELAWIGMVLVHPDFRRNGIGRALLRRCIEYLRGRGVRCIKLDATPAGRAVYEGLGFQEEWALTRWECNRRPERAAPSSEGIRDWHETDLSAVDQFDAGAFGISRRTLLQALKAKCLRALVVESERGVIAGHGCLREGSRALYLGPVVADSTDRALRLIGTLLQNHGDRTLFWDIPDRHRALALWAEENGFKVKRSLTRMFLGENIAPGSPEKVFAIAGPEIG
jgi:ribosomal protein S18 acetylase RimI-like enzyme